MPRLRGTFEKEERFRRRFKRYYGKGKKDAKEEKALDEISPPRHSEYRVLRFVSVYEMEIPY